MSSRAAKRTRAVLLACIAVSISLLISIMAQERKGYGQIDRTAKQATRLIHSVEGPDLFQAYCASCHGVKAKGNGPAASALKVKVPDLTRIAKRNGGKFPADQVRAMIAGEGTMAAHGSRTMPIWGPIFHQVEADQDWGQVRLDNLTKYLASIQE